MERKCAPYNEKVRVGWGEEGVDGDGAGSVRTVEMKLVESCTQEGKAKIKKIEKKS